MKWLVSMCCVIILLNCSSGSREEIPSYELRYDFSSPDKRIALSKILNEISGQTILDSVTIACIQDENGVIFLYDTKTNEIKQRIIFAGDGDYEGICQVQNDFYVLRSDGTLFRVVDFASATPRTDTFPTGIPADNNEGLCYDSLNNRLLIACKSRIPGDENKDKRAIYAFELATKKLSSNPVYVFDVNDMVAFALDHNIEIPTKDKKNGSEPDLKFRTSCVAIHPITKELYVLSAVDHALFIFDNAGDILHIEILDEKKFNKPEGICFYQNGDVLITNEAQDKKPTLMTFKYNSPAR